MPEVTSQMPFVPGWIFGLCFALAFAGLMALLRDDPARDQSRVGRLGLATLVLGVTCIVGGIVYNFTVGCLQLGDHLQSQSYDAYPQR
jgi:tetrahydromethanopterin S-methyltransferase subunit D